MAATPAELASKVALVTGAGRGIGRAISLRLAKAGAQLVLVGRDKTSLEETALLIAAESGFPALICHLDLLDRSSIQSAVAQTLEAFGRIDVLVNNSGITGKTVPMWELQKTSGTKLSILI